VKKGHAVRAHAGASCPSDLNLAQTLALPRTGRVSASGHTNVLRPPLSCGHSGEPETAQHLDIFKNFVLHADQSERERRLAWRDRSVNSMSFNWVVRHSLAHPHWLRAGTTRAIIGDQCGRGGLQSGPSAAAGTGGGQTSLRSFLNNRLAAAPRLRSRSELAARMFLAHSWSHPLRPASSRPCKECCRSAFTA